MRNNLNSSAGTSRRALLTLALAALIIMLAGCGDDQNKQGLATPTVLGTRGPGTPVAATTQQPAQMTLCYATGSADYPYVMVSVDANSDAEQQYLQDPRNIVPAPAAGCPGAGTPVPSRTPSTAIALNAKPGTQVARGTVSPSNSPATGTAARGSGASGLPLSGGQSSPQAGNTAGPPALTSPVPARPPTGANDHTPVPARPSPPLPPAQTITAGPQPTSPPSGPTRTPVPSHLTVTPIQQPTGTTQPAPLPTGTAQPTVVASSTPLPTIVSQSTVTPVPTQVPTSTPAVVPTSTSITTPASTPAPPSATLPEPGTATPVEGGTNTPVVATATGTPFSGANETPQATGQPATTATP